MPFIPKEEQATLSQIQEGIFGTKEPQQSLYNIEAFIKEVLSRPTADYVLLGISGYGVDSIAMHYYAVKGPLALFIQLNYGEAAAESKIALRNRIDGIFAAVEILFDALNTLEEKIKLPPDRRLLIVQSDFYGKGWGWVNGYPTKVEKSHWHEETEESTALFSALEEILKE